MHTTIKRYIPSLLLLSGLVGLSGTLQAAASDALESYDYTSKYHSDQVTPIEKKDYLEIKEIPHDLSIIRQEASKDGQDAMQLLAMVAKDRQKREYYKYLFDSRGLVASTQAQKKAHALNYHLVKAPPGHVILQVLSFLHQKPYMKVKELILPKDAPLCVACGVMCRHLFYKELLMHKKAGCLGQPFPTTAAPASAIACFYSERFTEEKRTFSLMNVAYTVFPHPQKPITSRNFAYTYSTNSSAAPSGDHQKLAQKAITAAVPLPQGQFLIPANGNCLYATIIMGYLLPVRHETGKVHTRVTQLFGHQPASYLNPLDQTLQNPTDYLSYLHSKDFAFLVTAFMSSMKINPGTWGGVKKKSKPLPRSFR